MINRRRFLETGLALGGSALLGGPAGLPAARAEAPGAGKSRVVVSRDPDLRPRGAGPDSDRLLKLLDRTVQSLFDRDDPVQAWRQVVRPGEVVGLKVNCLAGRGLSTTIELVDAICERLQQAGIKARDILIWDRQNSDLEDAGFAINVRGPGVRRLGNEVLGFEPELATFGRAGSLVCKTLSQVCDAVINLPVLKDHGIVGMTLALKNLFGAIHHPNKYHLSVGDPYVAGVHALAPEVHVLYSIHGMIL